MPWIVLTASILAVFCNAFTPVHAVTKVGSVTYDRRNQARQQEPSASTSNSEKTEDDDLPRGYVHQVPAAFRPPQVSQYPGDLSSFLSATPGPESTPGPVTTTRRPGRRTRPRRSGIPIGVGLRRIDEPKAQSTEEQANTERDPYRLRPQASSTLPGYPRPEGTSHRFTDTQAEFSFEGAGYAAPAESQTSAVKVEAKPVASPSSAQRVQAKIPPHAVRPHAPFGVPLLSSEEGLHIAQSSPEINYYPGLPSIDYPAFPEFGFRQKRAAQDPKSKKLHKTIKLFLHRMLTNKSLIAKTKKPSHLDKMVKLDTKMVAEASEYHAETEGFQASYPYFRSSLHDPTFEYGETRPTEGLRVRDRRPNRHHSLYATESRAFGYGSLGSGNFEVIRGGIFSDGHAESGQNPVHAAASYGGSSSGGGGGYDYEDDDEPILGFQGYNNFGSLHNALASRKRLTSVPAVGRRSSEGHTVHESQLIPMNADLMAVD